MTEFECFLCGYDQGFSNMTKVWWRGTLHGADICHDCLDGREGRSLDLHEERGAHYWDGSTYKQLELSEEEKTLFTLAAGDQR